MDEFIIQFRYGRGSIVSFHVAKDSFKKDLEGIRKYLNDIGKLYVFHGLKKMISTAFSVNDEGTLIYFEQIYILNDDTNFSVVVKTYTENYE